MPTPLRGQMTRQQFDAGRQSWMAAGGQDGDTSQNMTPAAMAALPGRPVLRRAPSATGGATGGGTPGTAASPWAMPSANLQSFGPGNDLRGTSILPQNSPRTNTAAGQADTAFGAVANFDLPQWNSVGAYTSRNSMDGIQPLSTSPVAGPNFTGARGAVAGALPRATQFTDAAAGALNSVGGVSFDGSAAENTWQQAQGAVPTGDVFQGDTGQARAMTLARLSQQQAPDRQRLALENMDLMEERSRPGFEVAQRQIGQKAAALGRVGSGVTTTELGDLGLQRERELALARRQLSADAAGQALADQLDFTNSANSVFQNFAGADSEGERIKLARAGLLKDIGDSRLGAARASTDAQQANADVGLRRASQFGQLGNDTFNRGMDMGRFERDMANDTVGVNERNENRRLDVGRDNIRLAQDQVNFREDADRFGYGTQVTERDRGWSAARDRGNFLQDRASTLGGRETSLRGQDAADRAELRGERTFQDGMANRAQDNRIKMQEFAQWLESQGFNNAQGLFGAGQGGNVGGAFNNQAQGFQSQAQSGYDTAGQLGALLPFLTRRGGAGNAPVIDPSWWSF